jgi:hypothetical protein
MPLGDPLSRRKPAAVVTAVVNALALIAGLCKLTVSPYKLAPRAPLASSAAPL